MFNVEWALSTIMSPYGNELIKYNKAAINIWHWLNKYPIQWGRGSNRWSCLVNLMRLINQVQIFSRPCLLLLLRALMP